MTEAELLSLIDRAEREEWTELNLRGEVITALPPQIGRLRKLKRLGVGEKPDVFRLVPSNTRNPLTILPSAIGELVNLTLLDLTNNQLTAMPPEIGQLVNLTNLYLGGNLLTAVPPEIGQLVNLTSLNLDTNQLTAVPPEIGQLVNLTSLRLCGNKLTALPPEIGQFANLTSLNLSDNKLTALPPEIGQFANLTSLNLSDNKLTAVPPEIGQLVKLTSLNLSRNQLTAVPPEIGQLVNLTSFYLRYNKLTAVPPEIGQLVKLTSLNLSDSKLTAVPPEIGQLVNLTYLYLPDNQLTALPPEIGQLVNLTGLALKNNKLTAVPPEIGQLVNLTNLDLDRNQLTAVPPEIGQLVNLTSLSLWENQLTALPPEIGQLVNLTSLILDNNQLTSLPPEIGQLVNLTSFYFRYNKLTAMPPEIGQLVNLTSLKLDNNQLTSLPPEIGQLVNLTYLYLDNNQLTALPSEIGQLVNLTYLYLDNNQLTSLPPEIGQLVNLPSLNLRYNQLTAVPPEIGQLLNLTSLDLSRNQLTSLPPEIGQLVNLTSLKLDNNQLTSLPPEIGQLVNLTSLILDNNQLTSLPPEIGQLVNLTTLYLKENHLSTLPHALTHLNRLENISLRRNPLPIPPEFFEGNIDGPFYNHQTILNFYFRQCIPLHQLKLMLLGEGSVGKTSLVERLLENKAPSNQGKTVGVEIREWQVDVAEEQGGRGAAENDQSAIPDPQSTIQIKVWDFGGQEIYHTTHQFFLSHRSLYLLVLDARHDEEASRLAYWLQLITSFGGNSPILLVINKIDQGPRRVAERELMARYPALRGVLYTSCTTGAGIAELRYALAQTIATMPHVNDMIPTTWMAVKEKLARLGKDFVSYEKYEELCEQEGITHPATRATLAKLLHDLGAALNFADESALAGTHILQPDWVSFGIYQIMNHESLQGRGQLQLSLLGKVLDAGRYPFHKHEFLVSIMEKFELCHPLPDQHKTWLIPTLLPPDRPQFAWPDPDQPAFQLRYTILPASVLARLMVRLHQHTWENVRWRDGMVLAWEGARARVQTIRDQNRLEIWLDGSPAPRRALLTLIRAQLAEIHASFANLTVEAWVPIPRHVGHAIKYEALLRLAERGTTTYYDPNADAEFDVLALLDTLETPVERLELLLFQKLKREFALGELKTLVGIELGWDYDEYPQERKSDFVRELVLDCKRKGRLEALYTALRRVR
ncbi:MAG: leucine-rich repeat domain-containing protein [Chloroflexi bacterium]|nr:leucine-rich repeat domain-containing protein [Chloroflexota bacterium]